MGKGTWWQRVAELAPEPKGAGSARLEGAQAVGNSGTGQRRGCALMGCAWLATLLLTLALPASLYPGDTAMPSLPFCPDIVVLSSWPAE